MFTRLNVSEILIIRASTFQIVRTITNDNICTYIYEHVRISFLRFTEVWIIKNPSKIIYIYKKKEKTKEKRYLCKCSQETKKANKIKRNKSKGRKKSNISASVHEEPAHNQSRSPLSKQKRGSLRNGIFTDLRSNRPTTCLPSGWTRIVTRGPSLNNSFCTENAENCLRYNQTSITEEEEEEGRATIQIAIFESENFSKSTCVARDSRSLLTGSSRSRGVLCVCFQ